MAEPIIVYVTSKLPYPLRSGLALRQFHLLKAYASIGHVVLVFFDQDPDALRSAETLQALRSTLHPVDVGSSGDASHVRGWRRRLEYLTASKPYGALASYSEKLRDAVHALAASADLVHVARLHMVPHVEALLHGQARRPTFVLDLDELEAVTRARWLRAGMADSLKAGMVDLYDLPRLWWYQRMAVKRFDRVFVCSEQDRARLGRKNVLVVPNGADSPIRTRSDRSDGRTILYCGQLSWKPNADAAVFLAREVLPRIRTRIADARVLIVGSGPSAVVRALGDERSVFVRADVPSVDEYYEQATLAAVPLRAGGGTRLKILEALSRRVPVVSTAIGCEGLDVVDREHLLVAGEAEAFAERCIELLRNADLRRRLADAGADLVAARYTWASIEARVAAAATELLSG
jgi:polysaccharide biosynthesis protein PslH